MALALPGDPGRSLTETLHLVESVGRALFAVGVAALLVAAVVGAFVVSSRPVGVLFVVLVAAASVGTLLAVAADVAFE